MSNHYYLRKFIFNGQWYVFKNYYNYRTALRGYKKWSKKYPGLISPPIKIER